jgi:hypothetical protein
MAEATELLDRLERLKVLLIARSTGGDPNEAEYVRLRRDLLAEGRVAAKLPRFLKVCTTLCEFWSFIKEQSPTVNADRNVQRRDDPKVQRSGSG